MVTPAFFPAVGGVERHVAGLARVLAHRGHRVSLVNFGPEKGPPRRETWRGIPLLRLGSRRCLGSSLLVKCRAALRLVQFVRAVRPDIVHYHDFAVFVRLHLILKAVLPRARHYITFHGWEGLCPPAPEVVGKRQWVAQKAEGSIAVGHYIERWYGTKADFVTYGASDASPDCRLSDFSSRGAVFAGRLAADTGIMAYLEAVRLLKQNGTTLHLDVLGDGPVAEDAREFAASNKLSAKFHGFVPDPYPIMQSAQFAFASGYLAIIEALSRGCLVIATYDNELKKDYVTMMPPAEYGFLHAPNAEGIRDAVLFAVSEPEKAKGIVRRGKRWARGLTWDALAEVYEALWSKT